MGFDGRVAENVSVWLFDRSGHPVTTFAGHTAKINDIAFSPDGQWIATASDDGTVRITALDGTCRTLPSANTGPVSALAIEGALQGTVDAHPTTKIDSVAFTRDGTLDVLAVLQVLGIAATEVTRPHYLCDIALILREGPLFEMHLPLASVMAVRAERKYHSGRTLQLTGQQDLQGKPELSIVIGNQTDVLVTLSEPVAVVEPNGTIGKAEILRFRADEPATAVSAIKAAVARSQANTSNAKRS